MRTSSTAAASGTSSWPAAPLTRVIELLAEINGVHLEPRTAWEAAAEGIASGREDPYQSILLAARRAGLRIGRVNLSAPGPVALRELSAPTLTWLPGVGGGRWVLILRQQKRTVEVAIVDESGERRRRLRRGQLLGWLESQVEGDISSIQWIRSEPQLPLASLGSTQHPIRRLLRLARLERADLGIILIYAAALGAMSVAVPVAVQALVNTVAFGSVLQPLVVLSILLAICLGFVAVIRVMQVIVVEVVQRRLFVRTAADFARRLPRICRGNKYYLPELSNRFFDVVTLQKASASLLIDGLALILQMAVGMVLLAFYHPMLLAFDLALLAAVALVVFVAGRGAIATSLTESKRKYAVASWLEDIAASPLRFTSADSRAHADLHAELLIREWLTARKNHFRFILRQLVGGVGLQVITSTALLGIGGWLVIQRQLTLGQLVAAELVVAAIGAGLGKLYKQLESFYDATTSATKLAKVVDMPLERSGGELLIGEGPIGVELHERPDRNDLDAPAQTWLRVPPGAKLGYRRSDQYHFDLIDSLFGLESAPDHDVRLDGRPLRALDLEAVRTQVALVRGVELITGTIADNLDPNPSTDRSKRLEEALEIVGMRDRVAALPDELQTRLLPNGAPLEWVEAKRLCIAEAILRRPRLMLLDGSLDNLGLSDRARTRLLDYLFDPEAPWTLVVASEEADVLERCTQHCATPAGEEGAQ